MAICILCTEPTKTKEHIFPAAMGGRRENSKIYCEHHNNRLGELVPVLQKQLAFANALIAVRGDRDKRPKAFAFDASDGEQYEMLKGDFAIRSPENIDDIPELPDGTRLIKVASDEQFAEWQKAQEKNGWKVSISGPKKIETKYQTAPFHILQSFGGIEFLRAVGYLGLTFFAVYFGDEARQDGLRDFKDFITTNAEPEQKVWWDARDIETSVGANKYLFGHTIVIGVSVETGRAYGLISLFGALTLGIDFGPVNTEESLEYVVNIDPKAEWAKPGVDVFEVKNEVPHVVVRYAPSDLEKMVRTGSADVMLGRFLARATEWRLMQDASQLMDRLAIFQNSETTERLAGVRQMMSLQKQRILNLLTSAIEDIQKNLAVGKMAFIYSHTTNLIVADESNPDGLALHSSKYVDHATDLIACEIEESLSKGNLTTDKLAMLIGGGLGLELVMRRVLLPAIALALTKAGDPRGAILAANFKAAN